MKATLLMVSLLSAIPAFGAETIELQGVLDLVQANHPLFNKERLGVAIESKRRDAALGGKDWRLVASAGFDRQADLVGGFNPERTDTTSGGVSAQRAVWATGGRLGVEWTSARTDSRLRSFNLPFALDLGPSLFYQNEAAVSYTQPLLRNRGGRLDRLSYDLGEHAVTAASREAAENQESFLLDIALRFVEWTELDERREIASERLALVRRQLATTQKKFKANLLERVEVLRSENAVRLAEQNLVLTESAWRAKQTELAVLTKSADLRQMKPDYDLHALLKRPDLKEAMERLRRNSRVLKGLAARQDQAKRRLKGLADASLPELALDARLAQKDGASESGGSLGLDRTDARVGLLFQYPFGNRKAKADRAGGEFELARLKHCSEEAELALEAALRELLIRIEGMEQVLDLNKKHLKTARAKTVEEQKLYDQGRGDLTFVIQSQDNEEDSRLTNAANAAVYHALHLRLKALLDELHQG
ncbi:TolC family protein [Elusimicrobiota bacterium]